MTIQAAMEWIALANGAIYAENGNHWYRVYATEPNGSTFRFEAGRPTMPGDYREEHTSIADALKALNDNVPIESWIQAVI